MTAVVVTTVVVATTLVVATTFRAQAGLVHRYSFDEAPGTTIAGDFYGGADGTLMNDKELLKHARRKEMEVRGKKPKHLKADFQISVITGDEFLMEKRMLARQDLYKFDVKDAGRMAHEPEVVACFDCSRCNGRALCTWSVRPRLGSAGREQ